MIYPSMYKKPGNPKVEELTKSVKDRSYPLSYLNPIKIEQENAKPIRMCTWCNENKLTHGNQKYCSTLCSASAMAWAYPQKEQALHVLLARQDFKCNICQYDYMPHVEKVADRMNKGNWKVGDIRKEINWYLIKRLKNAIPSERRLDVDHIVPIFKGGQSIGLENHQAICSQCHRTKTSKDLKKKSE